MTDKIIELHLQGFGRYKISQQTGVSEKRVRNVIAKYKQSNPVSAVEKVTFIGGDTIIDKVIKLSPNQRKTKEDIMSAVGFSPIEWECVSAEIASWNGMVKGEDSKPVVTDLYSVRVKVRPLKNGFDLDKALEKISRLEPVKIQHKPVNGKGLLEVFLADPHRGLKNVYGHLLMAIVERAMAVEKVVIVFGGDEIHVDNVKNTTVNGTQLEPIDLNAAWEESYTFHFNLIHQILSMGKECEVIYIPGNHDATIAWTIVKALEKVLPGARFDTTIEQYKAMRWNNIAIGWTHGDKGKRADFDRLFLKRYPMIFGDAKTVELHYGHIHQESAKDSYGNMIRSLPTATAQSQWTIDGGYESVQRFQLFEYDEDSLRAIYYV